MHIQINTDSHVEGDETLAAHVKDAVHKALTRFSTRITRVEVHLSDARGDRGGEQDMRCMLEARLEGRQPMVVAHHAATLDGAVDGATRRLKTAIERMFDRLRDGRRHP